MRFVKTHTEEKVYVKHYENGRVSFGVGLKKIIGNAGHVYVDWIGKKIIFTPTNNVDEYAFKITSGNSNMAISCKGLAPLIPLKTVVKANINEDGSFWIPALEEAKE